MMNHPIDVIIIGALVACTEGVKELWRDVATWAGAQLQAKFGDQVNTQYFDLFDPECPAFPAGSELPLVLVNDDVVSSGGKISIPLIRKEIEARIDLPKP